MSPAEPEARFRLRLQSRSGQLSEVFAYFPPGPLDEAGRFATFLRQEEVGLVAAAVAAWPWVERLTLERVRPADLAAAPPLWEVVLFGHQQGMNSVVTIAGRPFLLSGPIALFPVLSA